MTSYPHDTPTYSGVTPTTKAPEVATTYQYVSPTGSPITGHAHTERIIEFSGTGDLGGFISISERVPGTIVIDVYRTTGRVIVIDRTKP